MTKEASSQLSALPSSYTCTKQTRIYKQHLHDIWIEDNNSHTHSLCLFFNVSSSLLTQPPNRNNTKSHRIVQYGNQLSVETETSEQGCMLGTLSPYPLKGVPMGAQVPLHNSIISNFMTYQDQIEANSLHLCTVAHLKFRVVFYNFCYYF